MSEEIMKNAWQPFITIPKDGTPIMVFVQKKIWSEGLYIVEFKGKTFRYHQTKSRIFELAKYIKCWRHLPNNPLEEVPE